MRQRMADEGINENAPNLKYFPNNNDTEYNMNIL